MAIISVGPYKEPIGESPDGYPIYIYQNPAGELHHVVEMPDGKVVYADASGRIGYPVDNRFTGAMLGGIGGALVGPAAAVIGAVLGAVVGHSLTHKKPGL